MLKLRSIGLSDCARRQAAHWPDPASPLPVCGRAALHKSKSRHRIP